jgi:hypothetical protein
MHNKSAGEVQTTPTTPVETGNVSCPGGAQDGDMIEVDIRWHV